MRQIHTVTYTTIDEQTRKFEWQHNDGDIAQGIIHYITCGEWPEYAKVQDDRNWNANWGLIGSNVFGRTVGLISLPNSTQYYYYYDVLGGIARDLGKECVSNQDFSKAVLKRALLIAKEKDSKHTESIRKRNPTFVGVDSSQEMLRLAKGRLNYAKRKAAEKDKEAYEYVQVGIYASIIEEYNLFNVLGVY